MLELWFYLASCVFAGGLYFSWGVKSPQELEQATLLPFADDPEIAFRLTQETGVLFERVVNGIEQAAETPATDEVDKFIA